LQSGVFEVLDGNNEPTDSGRLVVTAFATEGTPLIRYDIGDTITLEDADELCGCGNNNPMVKEILGRIDDYIYSSKIGKINLGNISNTLKNIKGINNFQVVQNSLDSVDIFVIVDKSVYNKNYERVFIKNWRQRMGEKMVIDISYVDEIAVEKSGKFRIVKNNIKHLLNN
jgi:phenylacetate-CoA ligase